MTLIPTKGNIIIEPIIQEKSTQSGIVLTKEDKVTRLGKVIASSVSSPAIGEKVLFNQYGPQEIIWEGKKLYVAKDLDILAIIV